MITFYMNDIDISEYICSVSSSITFEDNKIIGNSPSKEIKLVVNNESGVFNELLDTPFIMKRNNEQIGVYYLVEKPETMRGEITLNLYDCMIFSNCTYTSTLEYPCMILDVINEISILLNKSIDTSEVDETILNKEINIYDSSETIRTHLGYISELAGCNLFVINDEFYFKKITNNISYEISNSDVESFVKKENYECSGVRYDDGLIVLEAGECDKNVLEIEPNNFYIDSQDEIDFIYEIVKDLKFISIESMKMISIDDLILGNLIQLENQFVFMAMSNETNYFNASYDISEISGIMNNTISNETSIVESNSNKIKKIQTTMNKNEGILSILSTQMNQIEKQTTHISDTSPSDIHQLWLDTSINPNILKYYDGIDWVKLNSSDEQFNDFASEIFQEYTSSLELSNENIEASIQEIKTIMNEYTTKIENLEQTLNLTSDGLVYQKNETESIKDQLSGKVSEEILSEYIRFDGAEIELGKNSSEFKTRITNDELAFYQGNSEYDENKIAYMSNKEMYIKKANIENGINIREFQFVDEDELGFSLM